MSIFSPIRHWFQKRFPALDSATAAMEQQGRFNALYGADPDKIVSAITSFKCGTLSPLARIIEDYEDRDDKMKICAVKLRASAARCDYSIMIREGFEDDPKAKRHAEILKRFWSSISVSSAFNRNEKGSIRLLKKQMMYAQSYGFSVHEIVWQPLPGGELAATFIHVPLWHFENHSGELRFLKSTNQHDGVSMAPGEWLVTSGDAIGTAAVICACAKHMSFQDWLLFSERCGIPMVHAKTDAPFKSDTWNNLAAAVRRLGRDFRILTDNNTSITPVSFANSGNLPYPPLVEWADRAIAALYRGADLSTISVKDGTGASLQGDESNMMEQDSCEMLSETLNEQVEKFVIRYVTGDDRPLAYISIAPVTKPDIDKDIAIDNHLIAHGCRLSKRDMCQRYGRTETTDDADAAQAAPEAPQGLANESPKTTNRPASPAQDPAQILARIAATILDGSVPFDKALTKAAQELEMAGISSLSGDLEKALTEAMFTAAASSLSGSAPAAPSAGMANSECRAEDPSTCRIHGTPREHKDKGFRDNYGNVHPETLAANPTLNTERGKNALNEVMRKQGGYVDKAVYRRECGWIRFDWGDAGDPGRDWLGGHGIAHIAAKHKEDLKFLPEVIARGTAYRHPTDETKTYFVYGTRFAVVASLQKGGKKTISGYEPKKYAEIEEIKKYPRAIAPGK